MDGYLLIGRTINT